MRVTVLGTGLVGGAIAKDLATEHGWSIRAVDRSQYSLEKLDNHERIQLACEDVSDEASLKAVVSDADLVVNAVPGDMGFQTMRRIIEEGKDVVDISFFAEDPFELDLIAKQRGVTAVVDCAASRGLWIFLS